MKDESKNNTFPETITVKKHTLHIMTEDEAENFFREMIEKTFFVGRKETVFSSIGLTPYFSTEITIAFYVKVSMKVEFDVIDYPVDDDKHGTKNGRFLVNALPVVSWGSFDGDAESVITALDLYKKAHTFVNTMSLHFRHFAIFVQK